MTKCKYKCKCKCKCTGLGPETHPALLAASTPRRTSKALRLCVITISHIIISGACKIRWKDRWTESSYDETEIGWHPSSPINTLYEVDFQVDLNKTPLTDVLLKDFQQSCSFRGGKAPKAIRRYVYKNIHPLLLYYLYVCIAFQVLYYNSRCNLVKYLLDFEKPGFYNSSNELPYAWQILSFRADGFQA